MKVVLGIERWILQYELVRLLEPGDERQLKIPGNDK
jgi:hypothetical protein